MGRLGIEQLAKGRGDDSQSSIVDSSPPRWVEVDPSQVRVQNTRSLGVSWLALQVLKKLGLDHLLEKLIPLGREDVPWSLMSLVLVICRQCDSSSELRIAEHLYKRTALTSLSKLAEKRSMTAVQLAQRVGRLLGQNTRPARLFKTSITAMRRETQRWRGRRSSRGGRGPA